MMIKKIFWAIVVLMLSISMPCILVYGETLEGLKHTCWDISSNDERRSFISQLEFTDIESGPNDQTSLVAYSWSNHGWTGYGYVSTKNKDDRNIPDGFFCQILYYNPQKIDQYEFDIRGDILLGSMTRINDDYSTETVNICGSQMHQTHSPSQHTQIIDDGECFIQSLKGDTACKR